MATKDLWSIFQEANSFLFQLQMEDPSKIFDIHQKFRLSTVHVVTIVLYVDVKSIKSCHQARHLDLIRELSAKNREKEEIRRSLGLWAGTIWVFPKIGVPPNHPMFNRVFHYKPSILGYHYFWKHPYPLLCSYIKSGNVWYA